MFNNSGNASYESYNNPNNSFYDAFKPNQTVVNMRNFQNKNDVLFNNIENNVLEQSIYEYTIQIDTADRDYSIYPNPFSVRVIFKPTPHSFDRKRCIKYAGSPEPTIACDFENVKYIKLDSIILPRISSLKKIHISDCELASSSEERNVFNVADTPLVNKIKWIYDEQACLDAYRYLILDIPEIPDTYIYGTNKKLSNTFGMIYNYRNVSTRYYAGETYGCYKIYPKAQLGNITSLTLNLYDANGDCININGLDPTICTPKRCICNDASFREHVGKCVCSYLNHPLNPAFQILYTFKIGVLSNDININPLKN